MDQSYINSYYEWLMRFLEDDIHDVRAYNNLLNQLFMTPFMVVLERDESRAVEGCELRRDFAEDIGESRRILADELGFCSILEMMIALSIRSENEILADPLYPPNYSRMFWIMISNLGLENMTDDMYDEYEVQYILDVLVYRHYEKNGIGGLFTTNDPNKDFRSLNIWGQLCSYINENMSYFQPK